MAVSKPTIAAVLFALLAIAVTLQTSEARVQPAAADQDEAKVTTTADGGSPSLPGLPLPQIPGMPSLPPLFRSLFPPLPGAPPSQTSPQIPGMPSLPPIFRSLFPPLPQIPGVPPLPGSPGAPPSQAVPSLPHLPLPTGSPSPPPPKECLTPLTAMILCMDYLTNITVFSPPSACCDGLKSVVSTAPICLCHGLNNNAGMSKLFPKPIDPIRMLILPARCGAMIPLQTIFSLHW